MTVIYSNAGDEDTRRLTDLWKGLDANVIELNNSFPADNNDLQQVKNAMYSETDTLLFCGHGLSTGLFNPSKRPFGNMFIFSSEDVKNIKAKNIIGIWCYAREFSQWNNVKGFFSSMFISNSTEAAICGIHDVPEQSIYNSMTTFCTKVNSLLKNNVPLNTWAANIQNELLTPTSTAVEKFNYSNLFYNPGT